MGDPIPGNDGTAKDISTERQSLMDWGREPLIESDWIRQQAEGVGLNTQRMLLGHALNRVVGDDENSYVSSDYHAYLSGDEIEQGRENALLRLGWELRLPELPQAVKEKLDHVKDAVEKSDWTDVAQCEFSRLQFVAAKNEIIEMMEKDLSLASAKEYFNIHYGFQLPKPPADKKYK